jgi:molecular chaperone GrpE (heat shock protein)
LRGEHHRHATISKSKIQVLLSSDVDADNNKSNKGESKEGESDNNVEETSNEAGEEEAGAGGNLAKELAAAKAELEEMRSALQYAIAERENVRRILLRDVADAKEFGIRNFADALLDVSDNFERALEAAKPASEKNDDVKAL